MKKKKKNNKKRIEVRCVTVHVGGGPVRRRAFYTAAATRPFPIRTLVVIMYLRKKESKVFYTSIRWNSIADYRHGI